MSLAEDLLQLAKNMANYKKKDLQDARLRRAVSTAYYAVFHLLVEAASERVAEDAKLRCLVSRAFVHAEMQRVAKTFLSGTGALPGHVQAAFTGTIPGEVQSVARAFINLQEARHRADYDLLSPFARAEVQGLVAVAEQAFADWNGVKARPRDKTAVELFLSSLLLGERWKK